MIRLLAALDFGAGQNGLPVLRKGWSEAEDGFTWSLGAHSSLVLPPPPRADGLTLELVLGAFVFPPKVPGQFLEVLVNGTSVGQRVLGGDGVWRIALPPSCIRAGRDMIITMHHPDAAMPFAIGAGRDRRRMSIKLRRLVLFEDNGRSDLPAPAGCMALAESFRFGWSEGTAGLLLQGWGHPEDGYVWSLGQRSVMRVPLARGPAGCTLLFDIQPMTAPGLAMQRIAIGAGGRLQYYTALAYRAVLAVHISPGDAAEFIDVSFDNLDAAPPAEGAAGGFAFKLMSVSVLRRGTAAEQRVHSLAVAPTDVVGRFESLGNLCDLGLLQRKLGLDQPGLLRFAGIMTPQLIEGLLTGFAGLGRPDRLALDTRDDKLPGYRIVDGHYTLNFRTPAFAEGVSHAEVKSRMALRLAFLVRKFFEDIVAGDKIFVFHRQDRTSRPEAEAVLAALSLWGEPTVLWITDDSAGQAGTVVRLGDRLLCGFMPPGDGVTPLPDELWLELLRQAAALKEAVLF